MKLKVAELMAERGMTAYRLAAESDGRLSQRTAYRLANDEKAALYPDEIAVLCDIFGVVPGDLFEYVPAQGKRG